MNEAEGICLCPILCTPRQPPTSGPTIHPSDLHRLHGSLTRPCSLRQYILEMRPLKAFSTKATWACERYDTPTIQEIGVAKHDGTKHKV